MDDKRRQAKETGHDEASIPIARRIVDRAAPLKGLFWRGSGATKRMPMVGWFDPKLLLHTGIKSIVSLFVGEQSDKRVLQALAAVDQKEFDHSITYCDTPEGPEAQKVKREEIWLDYICDTGDGWNPTYAIAYAASQPELIISNPDATTTTLPRGDVLVFGGDEVYPTPSREEYQRRLVEPYNAAFGKDAPEARPHVYAIPGNHDWYDGLSAFTRLFCSNIGGRRFAGWWTKQKRSYFAIKLPQNWWIIGIDGQLHGDIDVQQMEHFQRIADKMERGDKLILCLSTPVWVYAHKYRKMGRLLDETDLIHLREEVFAKRGIEVKVYLTGDLHHYRRHEETEATAKGRSPVQKITAGGGGAFLHPTHEEDVSEIEEECIDPSSNTKRFRVRATYPDMPTSSWIAWGNLLFPFYNPRFGIAPAFLYLLTAWLVGSVVGETIPHNPAQAVAISANAFGNNPGLALWSVTIVLGFFAFTDTHSKVYRVIAGLAHCIAHFVAMFYIGWGALDIADRLFHAEGFMRSTTSGALIFVGGWIAGSLIMGIYLLISINIFGRHSEEAFSGLKNQDFKHFLRLHIGANGTLTIHPLKVERVPRKWRDRGASDTSPSAVQPDGELKVERIEEPIEVS